MKQYIDKSALVAEIERIKHETNYEPFTDEVFGKRYVCGSLLSFLDTLEVKEVDLDSEVTHYLLYEHRSPLNEIMHKADLKSEMQYHKDIENAFKAGFELGMSVSNKAQKGEIV